MDERRGVTRTFLIADVRGYTSFTHEHGADAAAALTERFAEVTGKVAGESGGEVIEVRGDEVLVAFDSVRDAVRAAVALQAAYVEVDVDDEAPLPVGIGLDIGEAAKVGDGYRGAALNLAARLCGEARPGQILVSRRLYTAVETLVDVEPVGELTLKGFAKSVTAFNIVRGKLTAA